MNAVRSTGLLALCALACATEPGNFPLKPPLAVDDDQRPFSVACRDAPTEKDPHHRECLPETYYSPLAWDMADNTLFLPMSEFFTFEPAGESRNVNSLDEVADSSWFTNRVGKTPMTEAELRRGACPESYSLDPSDPPESWVIDQGKLNGSTPGFRVRIRGRDKFLLKADNLQRPERGTAASVIGAAIYHAVGFHTSCEQIVYFSPTLLKLTPGLKETTNTGGTKPFDAHSLEQVLSNSPRRGELIRMQASMWLPGRLIGPFRYRSTREDDLNDVIPHEHRRELRGARVLAAWLNHYDAREQNSMDSWIAQDPKAPDSSPGYVRHYYLDLSDVFGAEVGWEGGTRRSGYSYYFDFADIGLDFVTLGALQRPWERVHLTPGHEIFGYFGTQDFVPEDWKPGYPNPAFGRMSEHDAAWMTRIIARFGPAEIHTLVSLGKFSQPDNAAWLEEVLLARQRRILERYLTRLSPIADVKVEDRTSLCAVDLARARRVAPPEAFAISASQGARPVEVGPLGEDGRFCVKLRPAQDGPLPHYEVVELADGVARHPLRVHLYDRGSAGFTLVGLERPGS